MRTCIHTPYYTYSTLRTRRSRGRLTYFTLLTYLPTYLLTRTYLFTYSQVAQAAGAGRPARPTGAAYRPAYRPAHCFAGPTTSPDECVCICTSVGARPATADCHIRAACHIRATAPTLGTRVRSGLDGNPAATGPVEIESRAPPEPGTREIQSLAARMDATPAALFFLLGWCHQLCPCRPRLCPMSRRNGTGGRVHIHVRMYTCVGAHAHARAHVHMQRCTYTAMSTGATHPHLSPSALTLNPHPHPLAFTL